jgi:transposase
VWNAALAQRHFLYSQRGVTLRAATQCRQLTEARAELDWLADLPAQSAQQVLAHLDRAYDNWWNPEHPAGPPRFKKRSRGLSVPFPGQAVALRKVSRKWAQVPPVGSSRTRSACGVRDAESRPGCGRVFACTACGYQAHADRNAARNIEALAAGWAVSSTRSHPMVARPARSRTREPLVGAPA